jgi:[ribosomal protein S5]-alanine N-acetyltransferase
VKIEEIYKDIPVMETERLILRKVTLDDLDDMFEYGSDNEVTRYVTWETHRTTMDTKEFIDFVMSKYTKGEIAPWGIELKENGKFIGTVDFVSWSSHHNTAEIGYVLSKSYWRKGYGTEAANEIIRFGFEKMDLVRIQARCFLENIGSECVMKKLGMTYEGVIRKGMFAKGVHHDLKLYSILKEEYKTS